MITLIGMGSGTPESLTAQGLAARGVVEVHARIVLQVGLGDDDFRRSGVCQDGQEGQAVVGDLRDGLG